ncbi:methyl-accepting chemotaxis protein [Rhizobium sp. SG_E_25_P2]|uniref:HAMP domain-containing methyl-accepting chemotaxis protein n=1 Tax=Rhizobium sp. SG_E_25_P2 TaxID=2879942 RepID=UPI0024760873|nr:methyl-accepting chemotaxis protein [Rhizobium sp. SG_E_25_P2]MDH6268954.1 methyl-accepting chemotaxis protein [Rhizobium sp. SG_E_25_P2]
MLKKTLSLKISLIAMMAALLALLVAQGGFGLLSIGGVFDNTERLAAKALPAVDITNRLNITIANLRGLQNRHLVDRSPEEMAATEKQIAKDLGKLRDRMAIYEALISLPEEKAAYAEFKERLSAYLAAHDQMIALSRAGQKKEASDLLINTMTAIYGAIDDAADRFRDANVQAAEDMHQEAISGYRNARIASFAVLLLGLAVGAGAMAFVIRHVSRPIGQTTALMRRLAGGDLDVSIGYLDRGNEIGDMARAVDVFKQNAIRVRSMNEQERRLKEQCEALQAAIAEIVAAAVEGDFSRRIRADFGNADLNAFAGSMNELVESIGSGLSEVRRVMSALSDGDLTEKMRGAFQGAFSELQHNVNQTMDVLRMLVTEVRASIDMINSGSGELRLASEDLSRRTEQQAAALEETSSALEEITVAVRHSTERAIEAAKAVTLAHNSTEKSSTVVGEAVAAMERIEQASTEIGKIINVIDEIAFQTNLLALNAGVEAARAGEAGKGFAVVAQEVRELASRSAGAAKDIKALIGKSSAEVTEGVRLVTATGNVLTSIRQHVGDVNTHVKEISSGAQDQSYKLQEINEAVNQLDQVTQRNAAMAEETTASTSRLADDANHLSRLIARFRLEAGRGGRRAPVPLRAVG